MPLGDPAGIGPEIVAKSWVMREARGLAPFFALGDPAVPQKGSLIVVPLTAPAGSRPAAEKDAVAEVARFVLPVLAVRTSAPALANRSTTRASSANRTSVGACRDEVVAVVTFASPLTTSTIPVAGS